MPNELESIRIHERWLAHRAYVETYERPPQFLQKWSGRPNRCKCGCGQEWLDSLSPVNWLDYFSPKMLADMKFLLPLFRAFFNLLWTLPSYIWVLLQIVRANYRHEVGHQARLRGAPEGITIGAAKLLLYAIVMPLALVVIATLFVVSRAGGWLLFGIWAVAISVIVAMMLVLMLPAAIAVSRHGLVVILGGVSSIAYIDYPVVSIGLIVAGVMLQYRQDRERERHQQERIGMLILRLRAAEGSAP